MKEISNTSINLYKFQRREGGYAFYSASSLEELVERRPEIENLRLFSITKPPIQTKR